MRSTRTRSGGAVCTVIELLDREWAVLVGSPEASAALSRWGEIEASLEVFKTMAELVAFVECRSVDAVARDEVLGWLGTQAATDEMAARTLLQLLLPGAKALVARYRSSADCVEELTASVIADLYDRIRILPAGTRRSFLAPAVLGDVAKRLRRRTERGRRFAEVRLDDVDADGAASYELERGGHELEEILQWAASRGHLSWADAELIRLTRVAEVSVTRLSAISGEHPQTIRRRRLRAEQALAAAMPAA